MSSIDFEDFYRICSDSNYGGVEKDFIMIPRKNQHTNDANANSKPPCLEDFDESLDKYVPHEKKDEVVVQ